MSPAQIAAAKNAVERKVRLSGRGSEWGGMEQRRGEIEGTSARADFGCLAWKRRVWIGKCGQAN